MRPALKFHGKSPNSSSDIPKTVESLVRSKIGLMALGIVLAVLAWDGMAKCPPAGCGGDVGDWESQARDWMNADVPIVGVYPQEGMKTSFVAGATAITEDQNETEAPLPTRPTMDYESPPFRSDLFLNGRMIKPLLSVSSSDVLLSVSEGSSLSQPTIRGSVRLPYSSFLAENGTLRPIPELVGILSQAGISSEDPIVAYGDNFSSGEATFVVWLLRYLGQEDVRALDGGLEDWIQASLPLDRPTARPPVSYSTHPRPELLVDEEYVRSGLPQAVDARSFQEFGLGGLPNAIFMGPEKVLEKGKIKAGEQLNQTFARLSKERPVVVCSDDFRSASLVWYALQLMSYDSRICLWKEGQGQQKDGVLRIR
jgi:thiosulfate/3-mercaptopyruvate sulfurtransferase